MAKKYFTDESLSALIDKTKEYADAKAAEVDVQADWNETNENSKAYIKHKPEIPVIPTLPVVNDGTLTIQKNGVTVTQFTANDSENITANITVPTKLSDLTDDYEEEDPTVPDHVKDITTGDIENWNGKATTTYVDEKVASLVDSAPDTLDTLNELAAALGNDPNFATTIATEIGKKVDKVEGKGLSTNDYTTTEKNKLANIENGANKTVVDTELSSTSENPVQNKVVKAALDGKANTSHTHNYAGSGSVGGPASYSYRLSNWFDTRPSSANLGVVGDGTVRTFKSTPSMTEGHPIAYGTPTTGNGEGHILHFEWDNAGGYSGQIFVGNGPADSMQYRVMNTNTWHPWVRLIDSNNIGSFLPTKVSQLENDLGFINTADQLADALGDLAWLDAVNKYNLSSDLQTELNGKVTITDVTNKANDMIDNYDTTVVQPYLNGTTPVPKATSAVKATQDASGNTITTHYATKSELPTFSFSNGVLTITTK